MAPKKKPTESVPLEPVLQSGPPEEDEEGENTITLEFKAGGVSNLPCPLDTCLCFSGFCREFRSSVLPASKDPVGWELPKTKVIRLLGQDLFDDIAQEELAVTLRDGEFAIIGQAFLSLVPLLHEKDEVGGELELKLTDPFRAKWFPDLQPSEGGAPPSIPPAPMRTTINISVRHEGGSIGPEEDRKSWTLLTLKVGGMFSLPDRLTKLGMTGIEDVEMHQMKYRGALLGEALGEGLLTKPAEQPPPPNDDGEPAEGTNDEELPEEERRARCEKFGLSVRFKGSERIVRYRGSAFVRDFQNMLSHAGGVWFFYKPEEKPSTDPKKPNPPEIAALAVHYTGKAWVDLRSLMLQGQKCVDGCFPLMSAQAAAAGLTEEPTLEASKAYVRINVELSHEVAIGDVAAEKQVPLEKLLPGRNDIKQFPASHEAVNVYVDTIARSFEKVCEACPSGAKGGTADLIAQLKRTGCYEDLKDDIRRAVIPVFRERLRKDTKLIPGAPMTQQVRDEFLSGSYSYLKSTMAGVLDDMRKKLPPDPPEKGAPNVPAAPRASTPVTIPDGQNDVPEVHAPSREPPRNPVAAALAESANARMAKETLDAVAKVGSRCARLALEAELVGNWDRAAELHQSRLMLEEYRLEPTEWVAYAKFCSRARGRQAAAEEALMQAVQLLADPSLQHTADTAAEVDTMLACLLLDRGRHQEALRVFGTWHEKEPLKPIYRFLLGLATYLAGESEDWKPLLEAVGKPQDWFAGLPDDTAVADKLRALRATDGPLNIAPFAESLELLLEFGLPSLVFTFLDQCETLPPEDIAKEPLALIDAKASALERDFSAAIARLEPLLAGGEASQDVWRLAGDCHFQLQDYDRALQALLQAINFERKFDDPAVYIRLGHVLLLKKRWKQARDAFLRSISLQPTAEAWGGVAHAEYRSEELPICYEALCEANLLDGERADIWAQLMLVHIRMDNWDSVGHCLARCLECGPDCDELLIEVAAEYIRRERDPAVAETLSRRAIQIRDTGPAHAVLADALARTGNLEKAVLESQLAIRLMVEQPEQRRLIFDKALRWCQDLEDPPLAESLHAVQQLAEQQHAERASSPA